MILYRVMSFLEINQLCKYVSGAAGHCSFGEPSLPHRHLHVQGAGLAACQTAEPWAAGLIKRPAECNSSFAHCTSLQRASFTAAASAGHISPFQEAPHGEILSSGFRMRGSARTA